MTVEKEGRHTSSAFWFALAALVIGAILFFVFDSFRMVDAQPTAVGMDESSVQNSYADEVGTSSGAGQATVIEQSPDYRAAQGDGAAMDENIETAEDAAAEAADAAQEAERAAADGERAAAEAERAAAAVGAVEDQ